MARGLVKTPTITLLCVTFFTHAPGTTLNTVQVAVYMSDEGGHN